MKTIYFIICSLIITSSICAQTDQFLVWNKWCSKKDTLLLFTKSYNEIQIVSNVVDLNNIMLKPMDKTLKLGKPEIKKDTLTVLAMPYANGDKKMRMGILDKKTKKNLGTYAFTGEEVPEPEAQVGKLKGISETTKDSIMRQNSLKVVFPNSYYCYPYKIKSYLFKFKNGDKDDSVSVNGYMVTKEVIKDIFIAKEKSTIKFTNIKASCQDCTERELNDLSIKLR